MIRPQPYRLKWPHTSHQQEGIDEMFDILFKAVRLAQSDLLSLTNTVNNIGTGVGVVGAGGTVLISSLGWDGEEGATGPPGLPGATGPQGLMGPRGQDGEDNDSSWTSPGANFQNTLSGLYVPYVGAIKDVDLGLHSLTVDSPTFFVDSVNHRVGVGTIGPATTLEVVKATGGQQAIFRATDAASYADMRIYNDQNSSGRCLQFNYTGSTYVGPYWTSGPTGENGGIGTAGAYAFVIGTSNTARITILSTGLVGIGTPTPAALLSIGGAGSGSYTCDITGTIHISGVATFDNSLVIGNAQYFYWGTGATDSIIGSSTAHTMTFYSNNLATISLVSGLIGIGSTGATPYALLSVDGASSATGPSTTDKGIAYINANNNSVGLSIGNYSASPFGCWLQSMDMRSGQATTYPLILNPIGSNVGVGVTTPTARLHLPAGTATASSAPLKLNSGTLLTTAEAGGIEFLTDKFYGTITTGAARKTFAFLESPVFTGAVGIGSAVLTDKITKYNNILTAGWGVPAIYGAGRLTGQTAAAALGTITVGAADGSFVVSANVNVTTSTLHNFTVTCSYTDETNTARVLTMSFSQLTGAFVTAITNATGAGPYEGVSLQIRCKASTTIIIASVGVGGFTTVTYNIENSIIQIT